MQPVTYTGVVRSRPRANARSTSRPWQARINAAGQCFHLGSFADPEDAARAFDNAAYWLSHHGYEYERLNFPREYAGDNVQSRTPKTEQVLAIYQMRVAAGQTMVRSNASAKFRTKVRKLAKAIRELEAFLKTVLDLAVDLEPAAGYVAPVPRDAQQVTSDKPSVTIEIPARFQTPPGVALAAYAPKPDNS